MISPVTWVTVCGAPSKTTLTRLHVTPRPHLYCEHPLVPRPWLCSPGSTSGDSLPLVSWTRAKLRNTAKTHCLVAFLLPFPEELPPSQGPRPCTPPSPSSGCSPIVFFPPGPAALLQHQLDCVPGMHLRTAWEVRREVGIHFSSKVPALSASSPPSWYPTRGSDIFQG